MKYRTYGPFEIPLDKGEFTKRIDKSDITEFWNKRVKNKALEEGCGIYVFSIVTPSKERIWYVGKAERQSFLKECFTYHKLVNYHEALSKQPTGTPMMYLIARMKSASGFSKPTKAKNGFAEIGFVENMFIEYGYSNNNKIRNKQGKKNVEKLEIEGFYNSKKRNRNPTKRLFEVLVGSE